MVELGKFNSIILLLIRQVSSLADIFRHLSWPEHVNDDLARRGFIAYTDTELADMLILVQKCFESLHVRAEWDSWFSTLYNLGITRDMEKRKEYLEKHPDRVWT